MRKAISLSAIEIAEMLVFHLLCEVGTDVLHRHGELLLFVDVKPERLHLVADNSDQAESGTVPRLHRC